MPQELFPFAFLAPKSIKFELLALLPFRKYIDFSTLPDIKKLPICTSDTLKEYSTLDLGTTLYINVMILVTPGC